MNQSNYVRISNKPIKFRPSLESANQIPIRLNQSNSNLLWNQLIKFQPPLESTNQTPYAL